MGIARLLAELVGRAVLIEDVRGTVLAQAGAPAELPDADLRHSYEIDPDNAAPLAVSVRRRGFRGLAGAPVRRVGGQGVVAG